MTKICIACGETDDRVYFASTVRASGYRYRDARCTACQWKRREGLRNGTAKPLRKPAKWAFGKGARVEVLRCPHEEFLKGSSFKSGVFHNTLIAGHWTLGMVVEIEERKYVVCGNGIVMKAMKRLDFPLDIRLPAQWLTEVKDGRACVQVSIQI